MCFWLFSFHPAKVSGMRVRVDYEVCGVCVSVSVCVCVLEKESCLCVFEGRECNSMKDSERVYVYKK